MKDHTITTDFDDWEAEKMQDPAFRAEAERLEPAYQRALLRGRRRITRRERRDAFLKWLEDVLWPIRNKHSVRRAKRKQRKDD